MSRLVQPLRQFHSLLRAEFKSARCSLLQGGCYKRWWRRYFTFRFLTVTHFYFSNRRHLFGNRLIQDKFPTIGEPPLLWQPHDFPAIKAQLHPVMHCDAEISDLTLSFHNQAHCRSLHTAGRNSLTYPVTKGRRDHITHKPIQNAAPLLGCDQGHIHDAGFCQRSFNSLLGNLGIRDSLGSFKLQRILQMPGYRFSFPVRIGRQINALCTGYRL